MFSFSEEAAIGYSKRSSFLNTVPRKDLAFLQKIAKMYYVD